MSIRLGLIYPGAVVLATHTHLPRGVPTAYLLVMAYQQIWPFNGHPGSNDDSLYVAHAELAWPLNRLSAGSLRLAHSHEQNAAYEQGGTLSSKLHTPPLPVTPLLTACLPIR